MYNTGNPIGSTAPKDFSDNSEITDRYVNDVVNETTQDRFGRSRLNIHGQQERARRSFEQFESDADNVIANLGFFPPVDYTSGLTVDSRNFTTTYNGVVYAAQPSAVPFTTGAWDAAQWYPIQNLLNQKNLLVFDTYAEASAAAATLPDGQTVEVSDIMAVFDVSGGALVNKRPSGTPPTYTPQFFGAKGDGINNDTASWNLFQDSIGPKSVPPGMYLVDGEVKRFDAGCIGNGEFIDSKSTWDQATGDRNRHAIVVNSNHIDANTSLVSPVIKTQTGIDFNRDIPSGSFKHVCGAYHEATYNGYYNTREDTNQNFTVHGSSVKNAMAGLFGSLAYTGRASTAKETENPLVGTMGAPKQGVMFAETRHNTKHVNGGYSFNYEGYLINGADETDDVPYQNNDEYSFLPWTTNIKVTGGGNSPISSAFLAHGLGGKHGYWNGLVLGASMWNINGDTQGPSGTVAINLASQRASVGYADIGIKFRTNNRHLYFREGARVRAILTRFMYEAGACGVAIEAGEGANPYLHFRSGATSAPDGGVTTNFAQFDASSSRFQITANNSAEIHLSTGGVIYAATSARFAPGSANDGVPHLGAANRRFDTVYAKNATINTSDERAKTPLKSLSDTVLDAWGEVEFGQYQMLDAIALKGDAARIHVGVIAQRVVDAFNRHGVDPFEYGLLCYDEWPAEAEIVHEHEEVKKPATYKQILKRPAQFAIETDESGAEVKREIAPAEWEDGEMLEPAIVVTHKTVTPAVTAGNRYGIRYEEALCLEAAYQRRRMQRIESRIAALEAKL